MKRLYYLLLCFAVSIFAPDAYGQGSGSFFEANSKINVVVLVMVTIFIGIIVFLIYIERRLHKLEKKQDEFFINQKSN